MRVDFHDNTKSMISQLSEMATAILCEIQATHCREDIIEHHQELVKKFIDFGKHTAPYTQEQLRDLIQSVQEICVFDGWPAMRLKQTKFVMFCETLLTA